MSLFYKVLGVALFPFIEFLILRYLFSHVFLIPIGFPLGFVDADLVIPTLVGVTFFLYLKTHDGSIQLAFRKKELLGHLVLLTAFFVFTMQGANRIHAEGAIRYAWFSLAIVTFISALTPWIGAVAILKNPFSFLSSLSLGLYKVLSLWMPLAKVFTYVSGKMTAGFLSLATPQVEFSMGDFLGPTTEFVKISTPALALAIGRGCSGVEGFCIFAVLFILLRQARVLNTGFLQTLNFFLLGVPLVLLLNTVRLTLTYFAMRVCLAQFGVESVFRGVGSSIHTHLGWVLYTVGFYYYFRWVYSKGAQPHQGISKVLNYKIQEV